MPKTVLVICSGNSGTDFPKDENQIMLKKLLGDDFIAQFMDRYPENLPPEEKVFDAVLFAGCNVITWLFNDYNIVSDTIEKNLKEKGMEKLSRILKQDGIVIFVENQNYINKVATPGKSDSLSIPLEEMKLLPMVKDDKTGLKQDILKSWEKYFRIDVMKEYIVYKVKEQSGGKYKRKRKTAHKKRKTAHKKRKTAHKRKRTSKRK